MGFAVGAGPDLVTFEGLLCLGLKACRTGLLRLRCLNVNVAVVAASDARDAITIGASSPWLFRRRCLSS